MPLRVLPIRVVVATLIAILIVHIKSPQHALGGGKFDQIRHEVREAEPGRKKDKKSKRNRDDDDDCDDDSWLAPILGPIIICTVAAPFLAPHLALDDDFSDFALFPDYPYADVPGHLVITTQSPDEFRGWSGRVTGQYGDNFDAISQFGGRLQLDTQSRFGLDSEWNYRREELPTGGRDQLWTGDANAVFRFAQNEFAEFHTGIGLNWLHDESDTNYGFNFTYGADIFPIEPWVISSTIDWGKVGRAGLFHFRGTGGLMIHGAEIFTGYDFFRVGDVKING